ncbi:glycerophosphodiester phosphodiesterase family protein [Jiangella gansuensis]|uniref:glycerophosphodiester phosphodiesterase family protein n=1 Tax=Jiangella gansuensis TaxID=281473 RepID=UPI0004B11E3C|nr:glycerophosphodiester phosphodiesterase family protein [Jiangella gansuensis]
MKAGHPVRMRVLGTGVGVAVLAALTPAGATADEPAGTAAGDVVTIGHRGAAGLAPENTLAGIAAGAAAGPDFVEIDVQLSADGVPVLLHDATPARTTDVETVFPDRASAPVGAFTYAELQQLDAGSWFGPDFAGQRMPTFSQTLDALPDGVGVLIELKEPANSPGVVDVVVDELAADPRWAALADAGQLMTISFDHGALRQFHDLRPDIPVMALGAIPADDAALTELAGWADALGTNYRSLDPADIARVQDTGMLIGVYTVNGPVQTRELLDLGIDTITSDYPGMLVNVVAGKPPVPDANGIVVSQINANVPGDDIQPENGEHVVLTNTGSRPVNVGGYVIQDAAINRLVIGRGYLLHPGAELRVYTAAGTNTKDRYYNDLGRAVLNNGGDTVAVFTRKGTLVDLTAN